MKLPFLNRNAEQKRIQRSLNSPESECIIIYGRRRCGKSRLIQHILKRNDIYFLADQSEKKIQIASLAGEINKVLEGFLSVNYPDWHSVFNNLDRFAGKGLKVFIDEFPYLVHNAPELPSIIQRFIDLPKKNKIDIILCGSSQRMMQGFILKATSPLYGRANEIIHIKPLKAGWIMDALKKNPIESIEAYSIYGGIPRYWELILSFKNTEHALKELILDRNGVLHNEPIRLLLDDMRSTTQPYSVLSLIGNGCHRLSEIAGRLGKPATHLSRPLSHLIELGYIKRELPFGENLKSTKKTLYKLADPFLSFYFKYIQPHKSMLEMDVIKPVFSLIKDDFSHYVGGIWEDLARQSVPFIKTGGIEWNIPARWWGNGLDKKPLECDICAESLDKKHLLIGEVKWSDTLNLPAILKSLEHKAACLPFTKGKAIVYAVWSKTVTEKQGKIHVITPGILLQHIK